MAVVQIDPTGANPRRARSLMLLGSVALLLIGCGLALVRVKWTGARPTPRRLEVRVEPGLTPDGGWRAGTTALSKDPDQDQSVEVTPTRGREGQLQVHVRSQRPPYCLDTDLSISISANQAPSIEIRNAVHETGSTIETPDTNIGGLVRINTAEIPPLHAEELIIEYRTVGDCSGSPVERRGKVILARDELR